ADAAADAGARDRREIDAAVTTEPVRPHPPGLVWTPLYRDRFWLIAPKGNERKDQRELLTDLPFIRFDSRAWAGRVIDRELRRQRLTVREEMILDSQEVILRMVEKGLGVAIAPLSEEARLGLALPCLPFGEPQLTRRIVLLERQDRRTERLAAALAQALIAAEQATRARLKTSAGMPRR
ncbi:MAG: LysR family transcriptional regulator, partial [Bosea sp.]|nr:LysR family transcriptional regulator [Bosea sp. (in: a-proteobacteria)]